MHICSPQVLEPSLVNSARIANLLTSMELKGNNLILLIVLVEVTANPRILGLRSLSLSAVVEADENG